VDVLRHATGEKYAVRPGAVRSGEIETERSASLKRKNEQEGEPRRRFPGRNGRLSDKIARAR
jgi:hypothetical protein